MRARRGVAWLAQLRLRAQHICFGRPVARYALKAAAARKLVRSRRNRVARTQRLTDLDAAAVLHNETIISSSETQVGIGGEASSVEAFGYLREETPRG